MDQTNASKCTGLGIASVPMQTWGEVYRPEAAFRIGTIFPELNMPYSPPQLRNTNGNDKGRCR